MKLKNLFNIILFSFIMIVPLIPIKFKIEMIPLSADFVLGGALIFVGFLTIVKMKCNGINILKALNDTSMKILTSIIAIFIVLSLFSITYANHPGAALSETVRFLEYAFIFYFIIIIVDDKTIERSLMLIYLTMLFASIFGVAQLVFGWSSFTGGGFFGRGRIFSTFVNPNYWGGAINLVIFYPLIRLIEGKDSNKKLDIFAFSLFFFNLFFCSTRGSWIGFLIGSLLLCLIRYRNKFRYFIGIIGSTIVVMFLIPTIQHRLLQMLNIKERFSLWKTGLYMFRDNFWKGVGNGNYIYEYVNYVKKYKSLYLNKPKFSVHNSYIKMFAELGIFGGISFILMYFGVFNLVYKVYKNSDKYKYPALAFIIFGVTYLFQNLSNNLVFIPQLNVFVWIISALLYKGLYIERRGE